MQVFTPKGNKLRKFCYEEVYLNGSSVSLFSNSTIITKFRYKCLLALIEKKMTKVKTALSSNNVPNIEYIKLQLTETNDNEWDKLLYFVITEVVLQDVIHTLNLKKAGLKNNICCEYFTLVKEYFRDSEALLSSRNNIYELKIAKQLLMLKAKRLITDSTI